MDDYDRLVGSFCVIVILCVALLLFVTARGTYTFCKNHYPNEVGACFWSSDNYKVIK